MSGAATPPLTSLHDIAQENYNFSLGVTEYLVSRLRQMLKGVRHLKPLKFY